MSKETVEVVFCAPSEEAENVMQGFVQVIEKGSELENLVLFAKQFKMDPNKVCIKYVSQTAHMGIKYTTKGMEDIVEFNEDK